ncbi:715_t:CDS:2 [Ambispora leptoticha]|uniref:715_t:CDS:1 n=1 Tax=Ambispora leptoticha TaxID=144679 RepID=A0A9N9E653_9GLOM|nr:715_t:CDS:2 [Ambispora leptoticha]
MAGAPKYSIPEIEAVRLKMTQLNESQTQFLVSANPALPDPLSWFEHISPDYLSKFNVLLSKHTNLSNTLIDPKLQKIMLHPNESLPDEQDLTLRTLLRTKQIPEIEEIETETKREIAVQEGLWEQECDAVQSKDKESDDEEKWEVLKQEWQKIYDEHEAVCKKTSTFVEEILAKENLEGFKRLPEPVIQDDDKEQLALEEVLRFMSSGAKNGKMPSVSLPI